MPETYFFDVETPFGYRVHCTREYWDFIVGMKHPILMGREQEVKRALSQPDQVRQSRKDPDVLLFYRGSHPRWVCAVIRRPGEHGFLITAYVADKLKAGEVLWTKSE